ncbi:unnamed protein product [Alopecurus aequalis]
MFPNLPAMLVSVLFLSLGTSATASVSSPDTLNNGRRNIADNETLVSPGGSFTLGFFSPGTPSTRYLGIWFTASMDAMVWVANRDSPLNDTAGVLSINGTGTLLLLDGSGRTVWSSNTTDSDTSLAAAQLLESGNLVVSDESSGAVLWQSFDHPSNTLIDGMRFGRNPQTGAEWSLTSWRSPTDPATGSCHRVMDTRGLPDCVSLCGKDKTYRTGPWNGLWFSGVPEMASYSAMFTHQMVIRPDEVAYVINATAAAPFSRLVLTEAGVVKRLVWDAGSRVWNEFVQAPRDVCDDYARCGAFGLCNVNTASTLFCGCVHGFVPVSPEQWSMREASAGCRRNTPLDCRDGGTSTDGFAVVQSVKLPDTDNATVDVSATLEECRARCLANCSCVAFAAADIRLAKSELANKKMGSIFKILLPITACLLVLLMCIFLFWMCKFRGMRRNKDTQAKELGDESIELPFVSFKDIATATNDFSNDNILGQGGFGKVYKGMLVNDKEVAIKRLSKSSGQGVQEFRNEVVLIAKLQHRNLVRLLGCCIHGEERLLIYEYLPNKSLDAFIFDAASKYVLDWPTRFQIIKGVARGLLYLHQDSRLTIIHRDLKSSNILLDVDMCPKISDFGMARIFGRDQQEANTNRVVGT